MIETMLQRKETLLLETLLSGLDARETARAADAPMLIYLADMLIKRAEEELEIVRRSLETTTNRPRADGVT